MYKTISKKGMKELIEAIRLRYRQSSKMEKTRILDEFVFLAGCHRKHAVRLLGNCNQSFLTSTTNTNARRIYDEAVRDALIIIWEASGRICGKRLKAILPNLVDAMERHGHLDLDSVIRRRLFSASACFPPAPQLSIDYLHRSGAVRVVAINENIPERR